MKFRETGGLVVSELGFGCGGNAGLMLRGSAGEQQRIVGRAIDLKINPARFERHMRALWVLLLVPIGKLAPRTLGQRAGAGVFYGTLTAMTFLGIEQERFLNSLG